MSQPTLGDVHVNAPLTNLSLMYRQQMAAFVSLSVFPVIPVSFRSDVYYKYTRADFNRNQMKKRAPGTESAGGGFNVSTGTYTADVWSLHKDVPDQVRANTDAVMSPDQEAVAFLQSQAMISREVDWQGNFFATGKWTTEWSGVTANPTANSTVLQWNDPSSEPIKDMRKLNRQMQIISGGFRGNKLVLGREVFDTVCDHPDFIDRVKYGQTSGPAQIDMQAMAALFQVDQVLVMDGIVNSASEGATESNAFIGGKHALLVHTPAAPGIQTPGCGYTFAWTGYFGANAEGTRIKSFYMDWLASTRVEIDAAYAHQQVSADMGGFLLNVIA